MEEYKCLLGVMKKCPDCEGPECTYAKGSRCEEDNLSYLPPTLRQELMAYRATGLMPEDIDALRAREQGLVELLASVSCGCAVTYDRLRELAQADRAGRLVVLPCKIGDAVWTIKNFKGHERARIGYVSEMFFTKYMKLFIVVKNTGRGFWGENVFPSEAAAVDALERREEPT